MRDPLSAFSNAGKYRCHDDPVLGPELSQVFTRPLSGRTAEGLTARRPPAAGGFLLAPPPFLLLSTLLFLSPQALLLSTALFVLVKFSLPAGLL